MSANDPNDVRCAAAETFAGLGQVGEYVGLVAFADTAELWSKPVETTYDGRRQLSKLLAGRCRAGGYTATYDALALAYQQLEATAGQAPGSVVLLTDGTPEPGTDDQIGRIQRELVPRFAARGWPVHTVPIGTTETHFEFLHALSNGTGGRYYDQIEGRTATALDLLPLYVEILRDQVGRTPGRELPLTTLRGGTRVQELSVTPYSDRLDVVVVHDPGMVVTLRTPEGLDVQPVPTGADAQRYGVVFTIDHPVAGPAPWTLTVTGSGSFRTESLTVSRLKIEIREPAAAWLQLGQRFTVTAVLLDLNDKPIADRLALAGVLQYIGGGQDPGTPFDLTRVGDVYRGVVATASSAKPGPYQIDVHAAQSSLATLVTRALGRLRLDYFPTPSLTAPTGNAVTATRWPSVLRLYDLPGFDRLAGWALQGLPPDPTAEVAGTLTGPDGHPYTRGASISAEVVAPGASGPAPARATAGPDGHFRLAFATPVPGEYRVRLLTRGAPADTFSDELETRSNVRVHVQDATPAQVWRAAGATIPVGLLLVLLAAYVRFCVLRPPYGTVDGPGRLPIVLRRGRHPLRALWARNVLGSPDVGLEPGVQFRFHYRDGVEVRRTDGGRWPYAVRAEMPRPARFRWRLTGVAGLSSGLGLLAAGVHAGAFWTGLAGLLVLLLGVAYGLPGLVTPARRPTPPPPDRRASAWSGRGRPAVRRRGPRG